MINRFLRFKDIKLNQLFPIKMSTALGLKKWAYS
jgi:hypothetical protein